MSAKKDSTIKQWFEWAKHELRNLDRAKADIIQTLAEALEKWFPLDMISEKISSELAESELISSSYVRQVLADKYKNKKKQTSVSNSGATLLIHRDNIGANEDTFERNARKISNFYARDDKTADGSRQAQFKQSECEVLEFDLKQALEMGLKDVIKECERSKSDAWIIKISVRDFLVNRIENEITGFVWEFTV